MTTGRTLIQGAMRKLGELAEGESLSAEGLADGLTQLNALLGRWNAEGLPIYVLEQVTHTLTQAASFTVGPSGDEVATRPMSIVRAFVTVSGQDIPVAVVKRGRYEHIPVKTTTSSYPMLLFYDRTMPDGTVYVYPVPTGGDVLTLEAESQLAAVSAVGSTITLPPGYDDAIQWNLAMDLSPEYGREPSRLVMMRAEESKLAIERRNAADRLQPVRNDYGQRYHYDVYSDEVR